VGGPAPQKFLNAAELKNYSMPYRVFPTWIALIFFLILALGFASTHGAAAESTLVQVGYGGIAGYQLPLWVNKDHGISKKYGIELEPLLISGGALNMQALLAGSIQMSQNSASSALQAALRGASVALIAVLENRMPLQIIARPEIKTPQQLIGKKIGILRFGGSNEHRSAVGVAGVEDRSAPGYDAPVRRDQRAHDRPDFGPDRRDDPVLSRNLYCPQARHERARRYRRL
jgi:NMT1/THI5 like